MKHKSESLAYFNIFKAEIETATQRIKALRTDNGGKYTSTEFNFSGLEHGINCYLTQPETHTKTVRLNGAIAICKILQDVYCLANICPCQLSLGGGDPSRHNHT